MDFADDVVSSTITFRFEKQSADDSHITEVNEKVNETNNIEETTGRIGKSSGKKFGGKVRGNASELHQEELLN